MGVLRTWICQNQRCNAHFDSWEDYPKCPACRCIRVTWMPAGGNIIGAATKTADRELRELASVFRMTNIASAREGERAMPALKQQPAADTRMLQQFAPGFVAPPYAIDRDGQARAVCMPTAVNVNYKVKAAVGQALPRSHSVPGPAANAVITARHKG